MNFTLILGIFGCIAGVYMIAVYLTIRLKQTPVKGEVIGFITSRDNKMKTIYNPIVRFESNGETLEKATESYDKKQLFEIGEQIEIYILEKKDYVLRASGNTSLKNGLIFFVLGAVLIILIL